MRTNQLVVTVVALTMLLPGVSQLLHAAPLPNGTLLGIDAGANHDATGMCTTGSCFGMEIATGFWIWVDIAAGDDGGFIVGKDQRCGGQDIGPSGTNTTPGEVTAAWAFAGIYGTICANNTLNMFSDKSNDGNTVINDLSMAYNGTLVPIGGGSVNDYTITLDAVNSWSMDYTVVMPSGPFSGVNFWMITRGHVTQVPPDINNPPVVSNVTIQNLSGTTVNWLPDFTDDPGDTHICTISSNATNGNATVNPDCSAGSYTSGSGYIGPDSFEYTVTDQGGLSGTGIVSTAVDDCGTGLPCPPPMCEHIYPLAEVTAVGGGQGATVNASLQTIFTGHFVTVAGLVTGGKNTLKICPNTNVDYEAVSTAGAATCRLNGAVAASSGTVTVGDKLICTNKPDGSDTDRFTIKNGL